MDKALRDEFRAYKAETDDRLKRLEKAVSRAPASRKADDAKAAETKPTGQNEVKRA
jgi:hypothetical protein